MDIFDAVASLKNRDECQRFLKDLCTPKELRDFNDRWEIAKLLDEGEMSYREISASTGASLTTVTRVARFLKDEENEGYVLMLKRMKRKKRNEQTK